MKRSKRMRVLTSEGVQSSDFMEPKIDKWKSLKEFHQKQLLSGQ